MNKIKYALRFLLRQKAFTLINILGLTLSLTCGIVISRYLYREVTAESHAIDPETIVVSIQDNQVTRRMMMDVKRMDEYYGKPFMDEFQKFAVESSIFIKNPESTIALNDQNYVADVLVVDSLFLHFFEYEIEGDRTAMNRPDGCWVSRTYLQKLGLSATEAIGTAFMLKNFHFVISGIFDEPRNKAIFTPDMIVSCLVSDRWPHLKSEWIRIPKDFDLDAFNAYMKTLGEDTSEKEHFTFYGGDTMESQFIRWSDFYMDRSLNENGQEVNMVHHGNAQADWILLGVMVLILVVGVLNFTNLYMVYWQRRQREQGVRRVFGQKPLSLFVEMGLELFISTALAVLLAWLLVNLLKPWTDEMLNDTVTASPFDTVLTLGFLILVPLVSLGYPFVKQLRSSTLVSLQQRVGSVQNLRSRTVMLGFQYLIAFTLVAMAIWMQHHLEFLLNSPIGCDVENILITKPLHIKESFVTDEQGNSYFKSNGGEVKELAEAYLEKLSASPIVELADVVSALPVNRTDNLNVYYNDKDEKFSFYMYHVSPEWFKIFGVQLKEGQLLSDNANPKAMVPDTWVVNRKALNLMGYKQMEGAHLRSEEPLMIAYSADATNRLKAYGTEKMPICGIIQDHYRTHRTLGVQPSAYWIDANENRYVYASCMIAIRVKPGNEKEIIDLLEKTSADVCPDHELEYHWFSEDVESLYKEDKLMAQVYTLFSGIAILICCLGLLGISLFDIRQRYREIAIRKANGAHRKDLYLLLGKKYLWVLLSTFVLSIPASYLLIHRYTEEFLECAPITPWIYVETLLVVVLITILALIYQLEKAARVNVAAIIKSE